MKDPYPKKKHNHFEVFVYPQKKGVKINHQLNFRNKEFLKTLLERRSEGNTDTFKPITKEELSELLIICSNIDEVFIDEYGYVLSKRITPSAGARHPIDIFVSRDENHRRLNYFNPLDKTLNELLIDENLLKEFFLEVSNNKPIGNSCLIWFSIQEAKTSSKYNNPESLIWKDLGALIYNIQIAATYLGLKSCPLGTLASKSFNAIYEDEKIISGGGILIGK